MKSLWRTLVELFGVMPAGTKGFYIGYSIATSIVSLIDAAALTLIIAVATPLVSGVDVSLPIIGKVDERTTIWVIVVVCMLFILKGILALGLQWYATRRFARYELEVGNALFRSYIMSDWETRSKLSVAEATRIVDSSMANANLGFILPLSQVPGSALSFFSILIVLVVAQPWTALIALGYLSVISVLMVFVVSKRTRLAGLHNRRYAYKVAGLMTEMVEALKEVTLRGKLDEIQEVVSDNRRRATRARANISFLGSVPKYALESALIGGFVLVGGTAYFMGGVKEAILAIAVFAITGFKMIPALNSVQSSLNTASANQVYARDVVRHIRSAEEQAKRKTAPHPDTQILPDDPRSLILKNVSFRYPGASEDVLSGLNLEIPFGSSLAVVGPSGAGKSTLIDILLGLSIPESGELTIDGIPLNDVLNQWRARVGYVPQKVALFDASIAQNVALTWRNDFDEEQVRKALERASLQELKEAGRDIDERLGERGAAISGGQQQRMGIARALYSDPLVIVMDEATSALDTATENRITESLHEMQGEVTFITVAHRLATIRHYDQVCYLDEGKILGKGDFLEVTEQVPDFKMQASLAGLL